VALIGKVALFLLGLAAVGSALASAVRTTILPRGVPNRITRQTFLWTRVVFRLRIGRAPSYETRDRVMAMYAPVGLLTLLTVWLAMLIGAFTAMFWALGVRPLRVAFELSGSSIFTLGTTTSARFWPSVLSYAEAGLGLLLLTLLITYLPTIYASFQRREAAVTLLEVRAGSPPSAPVMLARFQRIEKTDRLSDLWQQWEGWFAEMEESHVSFPALVHFRSPQPDHSWVTAAGTILDAASLWISSVEHARDPDAQLCLRAGFICLRRIAAFLRVPFDPDPDPGDPITVSRTEYDEACRQIAEAGLELLDDREAAWTAFRGWRVNYDTVLLNLARFTEAPIAPWISDRSPLPSATWRLAAGVTGRNAGGATRWRPWRRRGGEG